MTNEEAMQMLTDMGLHEGGIDNWVMDNAWYLLANKVQEKEREACAKLIAKLTEMLEIQQKLQETAVAMLKPAIEIAVQKEREACAKLCEEYETDNDITATWLNIIADAIRARGQA